MGADQHRLKNLICVNPHPSAAESNLILIRARARRAEDLSLHLQLSRALKCHSPVVRIILAIVSVVCLASSLLAQGDATRVLSGRVVTQQGEAVPGVSIVVRTAAGEQQTVSDAGGNFRAVVPREPLSLKFFGRNIALVSKTVGINELSENLRVVVAFVVAPVNESVVIIASTLDPSVERRGDTIYKDTLFARDDQLLQTLSAGIDAGQHEGGGKSLEIRRFGFNLDHGGVSGGLKVLVDDVQQNQATQGHGQGYLGALKSLTPELVEGVDVLNGPFSAQYGDFSGLGVVHIRLRESLPDRLTLRLQGGSFKAFRTLLAFSPRLKHANSFVAYESSRTDGPFVRPLDYRRDNVTANYTRKVSAREAVGAKLNFGRNDFNSSGQLPLDEVAAGQLDRFGFVDPFVGGRVRSGVAAVYYRRESKSGASLKMDGFVSRTLFDLYSNFTFFLRDAARGDEIQQHDSRAQEGANVQYLQPYKFFGTPALITLGVNYHDSQINVGLSRTLRRSPFASLTSAHARVANVAAYAQNGLYFIHGHLRVEAGLRFDEFRFRVDDHNAPARSGDEGAGRVQPKLGVSYNPRDTFPTTFYFNYGRGIASQDARGVVEQPTGEKVSTTDFYQLGAANNFGRVLLVADLFLIDRSHEQVYVPDDGSFELRGASRSYGFELKTSARLMRRLTFNGGLTQVSNAFYRDTRPRLYVDSAPHTVANGALIYATPRGFTSSLGYRHTSSYRLDGTDARIRAAGLDVLDFSMKQRLRRWIDFNASIDNLTNKHYFETQNYFASRLRPTDAIIARIHGTPGYPFGVTLGLTFKLFAKE
jgi:outer membrane receptor protein involved in Fe transport